MDGSVRNGAVGDHIMKRALPLIAIIVLFSAMAVGQRVISTWDGDNLDLGNGASQGTLDFRATGSEARVETQTANGGGTDVVGFNFSVPDVYSATDRIVEFRDNGPTSGAATVALAVTGSGSVMTTAGGGFVIDHSTPDIMIISEKVTLHNTTDIQWVDTANASTGTADIGISRQVAGVLEINAGAGAGLGALVTGRMFEDASNATATLNDDDNWRVFNNDTGVGLMTHNLPIPVVDSTSKTYTFVVTDAAGVKVDAAGGDVIQIGDNVTAASGYLESYTVGSHLTLAGVNVNEWAVISSSGPWTDGTFTSGGHDRFSTESGITASVTQSQGNGVLTSTVNEVSTVALANDTVTLVAATPGRVQIIINNGVNDLQIFPASGDDLGAGANNPITLATTVNLHLVAYDSTNWETMP